MDKKISDKKIRRIKVTNLFHIFTHEIRLDSDNIVIIIGENGIGKTTVLKIIEALTRKDFQFLIDLDFESIDFEFGDSRWLISKEKGGLLIRDLATDKSARISAPDILKRRYPRLAGSTRMLRRSLRTGIDSVFIANDTPYSYARRSIDEDDMDIPEWITRELEGVKALLIESQRTVIAKSVRRDIGHEEGISVTMRINDCAKDLARILAQYNEAYKKRAYELDKNFVNRVLRDKEPLRKENLAEYSLMVGKFNELKNKLIRAGLIDEWKDLKVPSRENLSRISDAKLRMLTLYMQDSLEKLGVFNDLADKLQVFLTIVNGSFKYKQLHIDSKKGLEVLALESGEEIPLSKLSSGEQNELIMFFRLLFNSTPGELVMIDEPEISLHIDWMKRMVDHLEMIRKATGISILVSTHSPDIIGGYWDYVTELG